MGTNAAPPWARLTLRRYERATPMPPTMFLSRFLDDATILHRCPLSEVHEHLLKTYPQNLPFKFECRAERSNIHMLDIHIVSLYPFQTSVWWKPTHTCSYIPWEANVPRHIRIAWVKGEFIRYVRICSSLRFYRLCCRRLVRALIYLKYPKSVIQHQLVAWCDRDKYLKLKRDVVYNVVGGRVANEPHKSSLSQVELNKTPHSHTTPRASIHVFRVRHHSSLPILWSNIIQKFKRNLNCLPNVKIFTILKPLPNIKALFRRRAQRALRAHAPVASDGN